MERSSDKETVLLGGDLALSPDPDAARMADDLADHVLGRVPRRLQVLHVRLPPADRPFRDVVRPDVGGHRSRSLTVTGKKEM